jgi:hypothetical protein
MTPCTKVLCLKEEKKAAVLSGLNPRHTGLKYVAGTRLTNMFSMSLFNLVRGHETDGNRQHQSLLSVETSGAGDSRM